MSLRRTRVLARLLTAALILVVVLLGLPLALLHAQTAAPTAAAPTAATAAPAGGQTTGTTQPKATAGTPEPTRTPTLTPTVTPTLTELQAKLVLANTYLAGKDYEQAAILFAEIAQEDRGNAEALKGLKAALDGKAADLATAMAPLPTPEPAATAAVTAPTLVNTTKGKLAEWGGTALAALLVVVLIYLLAHAARLLLYWLRELWYTRGLPLLRRPAVEPGYLIGAFTNNLGDDGTNAARIVPLALSEKLLAWNHLVQAKEIPVEPEPVLNLGGMDWLKVLWSWILPAPRGYRVDGALLPGSRGGYRLAVQREVLAKNSIDRSRVFEAQGASPEGVFAMLAGEAAKWLVKPLDMEASGATLGAARRNRSIDAGPALSPSEIFDQALSLLLPVREQVNQGAIDFSDARLRLAQASTLLNDLPPESSLRKDLEGVVAELRAAIPGE